MPRVQVSLAGGRIVFGPEEIPQETTVKELTDAVRESLPMRTKCCSTSLVLLFDGVALCDDSTDFSGPEWELDLVDLLLMAPVNPRSVIAKQSTAEFTSLMSQFGGDSSLASVVAPLALPRCCGRWKSKLGECHIYLEQATMRLIYEESVEGGGLLTGELRPLDCPEVSTETPDEFEAAATWQAELKLVNEDSDAEPEQVGSIRVELTDSAMKTRIRAAGEDEEWQEEVTFDWMAPCKKPSVDAVVGESGCQRDSHDPAAGDPACEK
mmetsp:Transcript_41690/g.115009  ORF Transcript_41690/g.115009 Transcript_41690/m.115009 type:complete len:267 (-) Transcript_41690:83-883(-)